MVTGTFTCPEQFADNSYAKISENNIEIFGQRFPLKRPYYFKTGGKLKSFAIEPAIINYIGREIPIALRMYLYEDGKFHGASVNRAYKGYKYEHKGQLYDISGGIFFYKNGNIERFSPEGEEVETNFIVDGKKLVFYKWEIITFYEESGFPKTVSLRRPGNYQGQNYNLVEISETGNITARINETRPSYL